MKPTTTWDVRNINMHICMPTCVLAIGFASFYVPNGYSQTSTATNVDSAIDWSPLFDGKSLKGWVQRGGSAKYVVEDGAIVGTSVPNIPNSFLCTEKNYSDFVLEMEYKVHPELNSGIQIRSNSLPDYRNGRVHGYQVEIDPSDRAYSAGIYDEGRRGWLFDLSQNTDARYAFKQNDWNHVRIIAKGSRVVTFLNGVHAADLVDDKTAKGFIALQVHGVGGRKDPLDVHWRNIRINENVDAIKMPEKRNLESKFERKVVSESATVRKIAGGFEFLEGPALGPDGRIYFTDIPNSRVHVYDPVSGATSIYCESSGRANGLMWTASDALISCEGGNRRITRHQVGKGYEPLAEKFDGLRLNSPNDLHLDNVGGIYFTDPRYGDRDDMEMEIEGVYYINRGKKLTRIIDDLARPNGLVLSPDYARLYVADAGANRTYVYDVAKPGKVQNKMQFASIGSDGMTVDDLGNIYLTRDRFVHVFSPSGNQIEKIEIPEPPSNVTFGGKNRDILFVTARTSLYQIQMNVRGGLARANPR